MDDSGMLTVNVQGGTHLVRKGVANCSDLSFDRDVAAAKPFIVPWQARIWSQRCLLHFRTTMVRLVQVTPSGSSDSSLIELMWT